jgi:PAS domain S-box-containing protein
MTRSFPIGSWKKRLLDWLLKRHPEARESRLLLDQLFRAVTQPLAFKDAAGVYRRANDAMAKRFGLSQAAELVGKTDKDLPEEVNGYFTTTAPVRDEGGAVLGTIVFSLDVRPVEAAEQRSELLAEERDLLRSILNRVPDQIYVKNHKHQFIVANTAVARKIVGSSDPDLIVGKTDHDFFPQHDADQYRADEAKLMASGRDMIDLEERAVYQGKKRWNLSTKVVLRDRQRRVIGLVGINRDITSRKEAEEALAAERNLLHSLMDNIPDCIYFKDAEGKFTRANRALAQVLDVPDPGRLVGRRLSELLPGATAREGEADEATILDTGNPVLGKVEQFKVEGTVRWMLTTKVPIRNAEGQITGIVGISKDITERKKAEEALERSLAAFLEVANRAAEGDLTQRAHEGGDTIGRIGSAVNRMLDGFGVILRDLKNMAAHVTTAAGEILAASNHIAEGAGRQYDEIHTTTVSVEEMAASMHRVSDHAVNSADSAKQALSHVDVGDGSVRETSAAMTRINDAVSVTAGKMRLLARRISEISNVIEMIDEIASQSTLLSLNAAIQAAHAGEAGRGFGVVADEIRKLADRSIAATKEVGGIIETIQAETSEAVEAMENGTREVSEGVELAEQARQALHEISNSVRQTVQLSGTISEASTEQAMVTRHLAQTMETIAAITQSTSTGAHQTATTVQGLVRLSRELEDAIARFKVRADVEIRSSKIERLKPRSGAARA